MNILIVGSGLLLTEHGGGEVYVRNLVSGLLANNHQVLYLSVAVDNVSELQLHKIGGDMLEEFRLVFPKQGFDSRIAETDDAFVEALAEKLLEIRPDIIHAHGWKHLVSLAAKRALIPCIVTVHHGGFVCPAGALLNAEDGICAIPASDSVCLKCCVKTVPGWKFWYSLLRIAPLNLRLWAGKAIRKLPFIPFVTPLGIVSCSIRDKRREVSDIGLNAIRIIAPSPAMAEALFRNGVPRKKVAIVPHGIPSMPGFPLPDDFFGRALRFVFVGRISYVKGLHVLLKACQGLAPESYELHIVGSAATKQDKRYHNGLLKRFPVDNIIWHGGMANHEVSEVLRYCDVMVHPAICLEVFGLTIAEALSAGRPVIATRCGGAEIQVRDGENGLLVPPNDPVALRESMQRVIDDRDFLRAVAQRTGEVNSIEAHVRDLEKIYQEVLP